jgi:hypothetical protein
MWKSKLSAVMLEYPRYRNKAMAQGKQMPAFANIFPHKVFS